MKKWISAFAEMTLSLHYQLRLALLSPTLYGVSADFPGYTASSQATVFNGIIF